MSSGSWIGGTRTARDHLEGKLCAMQTNRIRQMDVRVERIPIEEKPVLRNLMELCRHDFSAFDRSDVGPHGLFGSREAESAKGH